MILVEVTMIERVIYAILVAVVVYLLTYVVLGLLSVATYPWALLIAILCGVLVFLSGRTRFA
jgi:hypothetical protein